MSILILFAHMINDRLATGGDIRCGIFKNNLEEYGYDVSVIAPGCFKYIEGKGAVRRIPVLFPHDCEIIAKIPALIFMTYLYRSIIVAFHLLFLRYDVFYSPGDFICDVLPVFVKKLFWGRCKWVCVVHHINDNPRVRVGAGHVNKLASYVLQNISFMMLRKYADKIITVNGIVKAKLVSLGFGPDKVAVVGNGVFVDKIDNVSNNDGILFDGVFMGRCNKTKGVEDLFRIWGKVCAVRKGAKLALLAGLTHDLDYVKQLLRKYEIQGNVEIFGYLPEDELYRKLKQSKVFLFPSYEEGWGIALNEALACRVPAVVYDLPVYDEMFKEGIVKVPLRDIDGFAGKVLHLLSDDPFRAALGWRAYETARKYDWDEVLLKEKNIIDAIVKDLR